MSALAGIWLYGGQQRAKAEAIRKLAQDRAEVIRGQMVRSMAG